MDEHALKMLDTAGRKIESGKRLRRHQVKRLTRIVRQLHRERRELRAELLARMREDE